MTVAAGDAVDAAGPLDVLLLEDAPDEAALVERIVRGHGDGDLTASDTVITVGQWHHADSLAAAIEVLNRESVDVVLSDLMVPDSRGVNTISALVDHAPNVPIIALTSYDEDVAGTRAIQAGAQDYLVKGRIDVELVDRSIRYAIQRKRHELDLIGTNRRLALLNRIIGHDIQREMSVAVGWVGELAAQFGPEDAEAVDALNDALANVVELADAAADVVTVVEEETGETLETRSIDAIVEAEIERFTRECPAVEFSVKGTDSEVPVLATPMLGSVFEHLFAEAIQVGGDDPPRPRVGIAVNDKHVTVTLEGDSVTLSDVQAAFLNDRDTPSESARRMRTGLYLAATVIGHLGGSIVVDPGPQIAVTLERPPESDGR